MLTVEREVEWGRACHSCQIRNPFPVLILAPADLKLQSSIKIQWKRLKTTQKSFSEGINELYIQKMDYLAMKITNLIPAATWTKPRCILRSPRSHTPNAIQDMVPLIGHSGKGKTKGTEKISVVIRGWGQEEVWTRSFGGNSMLYTWAQTHRIGHHREFYCT